MLSRENISTISSIKIPIENLEIYLISEFSPKLKIIYFIFNIAYVPLNKVPPSWFLHSDPNLVVKLARSGATFALDAHNTPLRSPWLEFCDAPRMRIVIFRICDFSSWNLHQSFDCYVQKFRITIGWPDLFGFRESRNAPYPTCFLQVVCGLHGVCVRLCVLEI